VVDGPDARPAEVVLDAPGAPQLAVHSDTRWYRPGLAVLIIGVALWCVATTITAVTQDVILVPTVILTGSFVIPLTVVVFIFQREVAQVGSAPPMAVLVAGFLGSGTLGVLLAALLETYLMPSRSGTYIVVALVEEACKGLIIVLLARRVRSATTRDGMVLGAVVGAGFAAFESAGYAFDAYLRSGTKHPLGSLVQSEIDRGLASPFGHIVWSSLLGGALFAVAARRGRIRLTWSVCGTYLGVVALHTLWDQAHGWAIILTRGFTGGGWHLGWPDGAAWLDSPTPVQHQLFSVLYNVPLLLISLAGSLWFLERWRRNRRVQHAEAGRRADTRVRVMSSSGAVPHAVPESEGWRSRGGDSCRRAR
jgi:RsiW-degrading membrane proteinase PrsW (M82 family)